MPIIHNIIIGCNQLIFNVRRDNGSARERHQLASSASSETHSGRKANL
jgi:hypothetical protein